MVDGVTAWAFGVSLALYLLLAMLATARRRDTMALFVLLAMAGMVALLFVRGSMVGTSVRGSMRLATVASVSAIVASSGDPTRLFDQDKVEDDDKDKPEGLLDVFRRANRYQVAFLLIGGLSGVGLYFMSPGIFS